MRFPTFLSAIWLAACATTSHAAGADPDVKSIALRTHTLSSPYLDSDMQSRWWDFGGDTLIRADQYIRLAPDRQSRTGWIFSRVPLTATNWEIEVEFRISGAGTLHGDGMAMWLTRSRGQVGPVFGSQDKFEGLGIFFDTYKNNRPGVVFPYVMAMVGDGQTSYDKENDGKNQEYAGCSARGLRGASVATKARLTYFQDKSLKLELQYKAEDQWVECFEKENPPLIPSVAYLGFSAETGELSDNFDIINVEVKNLYRSNEQAASKSGGGKKDAQHRGGQEHGRKYPGDKHGGGWGWWFVKVFLFLGVCVGGYVGFTMWRAQSKRSHRF